jgi:hypothetical protein
MPIQPPGSPTAAWIVSAPAPCRSIRLWLISTRGLVGTLGQEPDLDLAGVPGVRVERPVGAEVPAEQHPIG